MKLNLKFEPSEQGDDGVCYIFKVIDGKSEKIGYLVYENEGDLKTVREVLVERQPNVTVLE